MYIIGILILYIFMENYLYICRYIHILTYIRTCLIFLRSLSFWQGKIRLKTKFIVGDLGGKGGRLVGWKDGRLKGWWVGRLVSW